MLTWEIILQRIYFKRQYSHCKLSEILITVQFSSVAQSCQTLGNSMDCSMPALLSITNTQNLLKVMSTESEIRSSHLILSRPLLLLPSIIPSITVFSEESALPIRWSKYWSFSFNISPSEEYTGLIFFRMDCLDFLAVQGTLKSLLQHQVLGCSAFFSPTLTSIRDHWKNHSFDQMDLC